MLILNSQTFWTDPHYISHCLGLYFTCLDSPCLLLLTWCSRVNRVAKCYWEMKIRQTWPQCHSYQKVTKFYWVKFVKTLLYSSVQVFCSIISVYFNTGSSQMNCKTCFTHIQLSAVILDITLHKYYFSHKDLGIRILLRHFDMLTLHLRIKQI